MIARTLVGSSLRRSTSRRCDAASSSMKSGLPSAVSATLRERVLRERRLGQQLLGELVTRGVRRAARAGGRCRPGARRPRSAGRRGARAARARRRAPGRRAPARRASRAGRAGWVGPVDVLEEEQRRTAHRQRLDEDARREEERLAIGDAALAVQPEKHRELRGVLLGGRRPGELGDAGRELRPRLAGSSLSKIVRGLLDLLPNALYGVLAPYGVERPRIDAPPGPRRAGRARARVVTCRSRPGRTRSRTAPALARSTRSQIPVRTASSRSRPIIGTGATGRSPAAMSHGGRATPGPARSCPSRGPAAPGGTRSALRVAAYVSSPTSTAPTGAAVWSRAAVFTTSPATMASPCPGRASSSTIASPVFTAIRICSPSAPPSRGPRTPRGQRARGRRRTPSARRRRPSPRRR